MAVELTAEVTEVTAAVVWLECEVVAAEPTVAGITRPLLVMYVTAAAEVPAVAAWVELTAAVELTAGVGWLAVDTTAVVGWAAVELTAVVGRIVAVELRGAVSTDDTDTIDTVEDVESAVE